MQLPHHKAPRIKLKSRVPDCANRGTVVRSASVLKCEITRDTIDVPVRECTVNGECVERKWEGKALELTACVDCKTVEAPQPENSPEEEQRKPVTDARGFVLNYCGTPADQLKNVYQGASCFLVCGGPSVQTMPLELLQKRGVLIAAVNNIAATFVRPHLWFSVDGAGNFHESIWKDPAIMKLVRRDRSGNKLRTSDGDQWKATTIEAAHCPNTWFYKYGSGFNSETFLTCNPPIWEGVYKLDNGEDRNTKSCMLPALRLLFWLGIRTLYLVGVDFKMENVQPYAFHEAKEAGPCGSNNTTYGVLNHWFEELNPILLANGMRVINVTPQSNLRAFPTMDFVDAVNEVTSNCPSATTVRGMYG